eukprot:m.915709 g.915709  ORF g.915709 m.915709 type:complete len:161 (+) comp23732_c0_seq93:1963-2445(+)
MEVGSGSINCKAWYEHLHQLQNPACHISHEEAGEVLNQVLPALLATRLSSHAVSPSASDAWPTNVHSRAATCCARDCPHLPRHLTREGCYHHANSHICIGYGRSRIRVGDGFSVRAFVGVCNEGGRHLPNQRCCSVFTPWDLLSVSHFVAVDRGTAGGKR